MATEEQVRAAMKGFMDSMTASMREIVTEVKNSIPQNDQGQDKDKDKDLVRGLTPKQLATFQRNTDSFKKGRPYFQMGSQTFSQFMEYFDIALKEAQFEPALDDGTAADSAVEKEKKAVYKRLLFNSLAGEARKLASRRANPEKGDEMIKMSFTAYAERLRLLFEPPSQSEASRQEFLSRVQQRGENPLMYFSDKIALWERAWSAEQRDIVTLVDETTAGLLNEDLRREMRRSHARSEADYDRDLRFAINSIRKQLIAGELPNNDGEGLELQSSTMSYLGGRQNLSLQPPQVKEEPIFAIARRGAANRGRCFHCLKLGHFIAACPRKKAGLPAIQAAEREPDPGAESDGKEVSSATDSDEAPGEPSAAALRKGRPRGALKKNAGRRVQLTIPENKWRRSANRQRLGTLYRVGNEVTIVEPATDDEDDVEDEEEAISFTSAPEPVSTVLPESPETDQLDFLDLGGL